MAEASRLMGQAGVDPATAPRLLAPLAIASIQQAVEKGPASALTGPLLEETKPPSKRTRNCWKKPTPILQKFPRLLGQACSRFKSTEGQLNSGVLGELKLLTESFHNKASTPCRSNEPCL